MIAPERLVRITMMLLSRDFRSPPTQLTQTRPYHNEAWAIFEDMEELIQKHGFDRRNFKEILVILDVDGNAEDDMLFFLWDEETDQHLNQAIFAGVQLWLDNKLLTQPHKSKNPEPPSFYFSTN